MKPSIAHRLTHGKKEILTHERMGYGPMNLAAAKEALLMVKDAFGKTPFFLLYGTLLGAIREGEFIAWDKDIDLGCFETDMENVYQAILSLIAKGFDVTRTYKDDTYFQIRWNKICCDFCVMQRYSDDRWHWGGRFYESPDWFSKLKEVPFLGTTFLVPERSEDFLAQHYTDWRVPNPKCLHAKLPKRCR